MISEMYSLISSDISNEETVSDGLISVYSNVCFMSTALWWQWIQALSLKAAQKYAREFTVNCTALILDCLVSAKRIRTQTAI
jgi:hypothetical protein